MSIEAKLERLALNKAAIKAAIENKNPSIPPTGDMDNWPTSIMSIPAPEPVPEPEPLNLYERPSDWPDLETILAQHPASEKGYGYAYAMLVEGQNPVSSYNYIRVPPKSAGCRHYVTSWGLDEEPTNAWQTWVLSDPNTYNKYEWIVVYTDSDHDITMWGPKYYPYVYRWLLWFYAPGATVSAPTNDDGFCGIISLREVTAKQFNSKSDTFSAGKGDFYTAVNIEKYKDIDVGGRINGTFFMLRLGKNVDFEIEIQNTATDIHDMFIGQYCITYIKPFSVPSSVTTIAATFSQCYSLLGIDVSGWDTSNVTNMSGTFYRCRSMKSLDLSKWDVGKVNTFSQMFYQCYSLRTLDTTGWSPRSVTDVASMFFYCCSLERVDMSNWDVSNVTNCRDMFSQCFSLKTISSSGCKFSNSTTFASMFAQNYSLESVDVSDFDGSNVTTTQNMFADCCNLMEIDVSKWNLGKSGTFTEMRNMFIGCNKLKSLDLTSWDVSKVTSFNSVFSNCFALKSINVSGLDTGNVTDMQNTFNGCYSLEYVDVSGWDVSSVTTLQTMFFQNYNLASIDVSNWNVQKVTTCYALFGSCHCLTEIDISEWNLASMTNMNNMFSDCYALLEVKLPKMSTVYTAQFSNCSSCLLYDFRKCESVPALQNTNAFQNINANAKIVVPDSLYSSWRMTTNWSNSAIQSKIISASDYEAL